VNKINSGIRLDLVFSNGGYFMIINDLIFTGSMTVDLDDLQTELKEVKSFMTAYYGSYVMYEAANLGYVLHWTQSEQALIYADRNEAENHYEQQRIHWEQ
jgi:hypothetical protein